VARDFAFQGNLARIAAKFGLAQFDHAMQAERECASLSTRR
jgi:hypothetical protein